MMLNLKNLCMLYIPYSRVKLEMKRPEPHENDEAKQHGNNGCLMKLELFLYAKKEPCCLLKYEYLSCRV
jgi:hypothetical protein